MFLSSWIIFFAICEKNNSGRNSSFFLKTFEIVWQNFFSLQIVIDKHRRENFLDQT